MSHVPNTGNASRDPLIGKVIGGRYEVLSRLGAGGMGKVYKARHLNLDSMIALKVLYQHLVGDPTVVKRFEREARAASRLKHDNIVQITDFGEDEQVGYFFCMEHLDGESLQDRIKRERQLPVPVVCHILCQVCDALQIAHQNGIVHRDLKPENIFLIQKGWQRDVAKVLDFGIAAMSGGESTDANMRLTRAGTLFGTPAYSSPEQGVGLDLDYRTDIYALGVIAYEMITGEVPFQAQTYVLLMDKHRHEAPRPPREVRADLPPKLEQIILRCLAKNRDDRYQSAAEIIQALMTLTPTPVAALPHGQGQPISPFQSGHLSPGIPAGYTPQAGTPPGASPIPGSYPGYNPYAYASGYFAVTPLPQPQFPPKAGSRIPWWLWMSFAVLLVAAAALVIVLALKRGPESDGKEKKPPNQTTTKENPRPEKRTPTKPTARTVPVVAKVTVHKAPADIRKPAVTPTMKKQPERKLVTPKNVGVVLPIVTPIPKGHTPPEVAPKPLPPTNTMEIKPLDPGTPQFQRVSISFRSKQRRVKILLGDVEIGRTPLTKTFFRRKSDPLVFAFVKGGYEKQVMTVTPDHDQQIQIALKRRTRAPRVGRVVKPVSTRRDKPLPVVKKSEPTRRPKPVVKKPIETDVKGPKPKKIKNKPIKKKPEITEEPL